MTNFEENTLTLSQALRLKHLKIGKAPKFALLFSLLIFLIIPEFVLMQNITLPLTILLYSITILFIVAFLQKGQKKHWKGILKIGIALGVVCFIVLSLSVFFAPQVSSSPGWLSGWTYRKDHVIVASSGAGTGYTVCIKVHYGSGTDGATTYYGVPAGEVWLNSHSKTDFSDVRFTASDGVTLLPYYPEKIAVALKNGGFENDFNGWINSYSEISTTVYHSGLKSCYQTYSQNVYQYFSSAISIDSISNFTCWIKKGSGDGNEYVLFYTTGTSGNYLIGHGSAAQDWHKVDLLAAYVASGSSGDLLGIGFVRMDDNFVDYWIDDVTLLTNFECTVSPDTASLIIGQTQDFTCSALGGSSPYSYQWYLNGTAIGSNSSTYTFNATVNGFYNLWCNVTDSWSPSATPLLYEYYNTGADSYVSLYGVVWRGQTFTVGSVGHTVTSVKIKCTREGYPQTVTVSIRATDVDGHPTVTDLTSGTIDGNTFTINPAGAWYEITLTKYTLSANTKYAIVVRALNGDQDNRVEWKDDESSPTYTDGNLESSGDSGDTWSSDISRDFMFEVWGAVTIVKSNIAQITVSPPASAPTASNIGYTSSTAGSSCVFHAKMMDAVGLSEYIFSFDNGLGWFSNDSAVAFTANPAWANTTKTLTSAVGVTVRFRWFFSNTYGLWGATPIQTFTTTGNYPPSITGVSFILDSTDLGTVRPGEKRAFNMTFRFDGQTLVFQDIQFKGDESGWFQKPNNLPQTYMKNIYSSAPPYITVVVQVPSDAAEGLGTVRATAYAFDSFGAMLTSSAPVTFTVQNLPFPFIIDPTAVAKALTQLIRLLGNPLILLLLVATVVWFGYYTLRKKRR